MKAEYQQRAENGGFPAPNGSGFHHGEYVYIVSRAELDVLIATLIDIRDEAESREDVLDGPDGQPRPNAWMHVAELCREALAKAGVKE